MILWHGNFPLDYSSIESSVASIKSNPICWDEDLKQWSSYFLYDRPDKILTNFYVKIAERVSKDLTLYERVKYKQAYWMQIYPPKSKGHPQHDHFTGDEIYSWVHFIKPTENCFHFLVSGEKVYPPQQNAGDYIVFPSWALHAVDGNDTNDERIVAAGNVMMETLRTDYHDGTTKINTCHKFSDNALVWEVDD